MRAKGLKKNKMVCIREVFTIILVSFKNFLLIYILMENEIFREI